MNEINCHYQNTKGLYVITNNDDFDTLRKKLKLITSYSCVNMLQYRRKHVHPSKQLAEAIELQKLCLNQHIHFIINDDMFLAEKLQQHGNCGVHLGQQDGDIRHARKMLGEKAIIGRTCHQSLSLAHTAAIEGANYVAFGAYQPSKSKPNVKTVSPTILSQAKKQLGIPICAIGGIQSDDFDTLNHMGIDLIAVISNVLSGDLQSIKNTMMKWQDKYHYSL